MTSKEATSLPLSGTLRVVGIRAVFDFFPSHFLHVLQEPCVIFKTRQKFKEDRVVTHGETSRGLIIVNSLCNYTFSEFSKAAAVSRGDADIRVGCLSKKPNEPPPCHGFHGKCMRLGRARKKGWVRTRGPGTIH